MLDPKLLRSELEQTAQRLAARGYTLDTARFSALEGQRKTLQVRAETLQQQRNERSKSIGQAKAAGADIQPLLAEVADLGDQLKSSQEELAQIQQQLQDWQMEMPNLLHESTPLGDSEDDNVEIRRCGAPREFSFAPRDHVDVGAGLLDFDAASKLTGARFVVMRGALARLHRALAQFMLDLHTREHGYVEVNVPQIVNAASLQGTGQLPKFAEDQFALAGDSAYYLIATAEIPVTNLVRGEIVDAEQLPLKFRLPFGVFS